MSAPFPQATKSPAQAGRLSRWLAAFGFATVTDQPVDQTILANWLAEVREMQARASALAEKPPLTSY